MGTQQDGSSNVMAACVEEDGTVRCPVWRRVQQEARMMVRAGIARVENCMPIVKDTAPTEVQQQQ